MNTKTENVPKYLVNATALSGIGAAATGTTAATIGDATTVTTAGVSTAAVIGAGSAVGGALKLFWWRYLVLGSPSVDLMTAVILGISVGILETILKIHYR